MCVQVYLFTLQIQCRRSFIEKQDLRLSNQCPSNGNPLLLSARQLRTFTTQTRIIALAHRKQTIEWRKKSVIGINCRSISGQSFFNRIDHQWQFNDEIMNVRQLCSFNDFIDVYVTPIITVSNILGNRPIEQNGLLRNDAKLGP